MNETYATVAVTLVLGLLTGYNLWNQTKLTARQKEQQAKVDESKVVVDAWKDLVKTQQQMYETRISNAETKATTAEANVAFFVDHYKRCEDTLEAQRVESTLLRKDFDKAKANLKEAGLWK